ncbi:MAG: TlpA disulfide reductase family protein [Bacteroidota bacterium]
MKKYLLTLNCFLLLCFSASSQTPNARSASMLDSGKTMHFIPLSDINGHTIKPADLAGKIVVMDFWFLACAPCRYELPNLSDIADSYKNNKDIVFIAIALDSVSALRDFLKTNTFNYQQVADGKEIHANYAVSTCPLNLVIDKNGIIIYNSYSERYKVAAIGHIKEILKNLN